MAVSHTRRVLARIGAPATIVGCAAFVQAFDTSAVAVALPDIAREFGGNALSYDKVIIAYLIGATAVLPLCGWTVERFGARKMFMLAIALFGGAATMCGMATSVTMLLTARVVEGCAGAMLLPVGRVIVLRSVPEEGFVKAMAAMTMPILLGPVIGPPLGGMLVTFGSWRWLFLAMVPVTIVGFFLVFRCIEKIEPSHREPLDVPGAFMLVGGLAAVATGVGSLGGDEPAIEDAFIRVSAGMAAFFVYFLHVRRSRAPLLDIGPLANQLVRVSNFGGMFVRMLTSAMPFLLAILFQQRFGMSAVEAGGLIFTIALGSIAGRSVMPWLVRQLGFRTLLSLNCVAVALTVAACGLFDKDIGTPVIIAVLFVQGALRSTQMIAISVLGFCGLPQKDFAAASTLSSISQQLSQGFGIAISAFSVHLITMTQGVDEGTNVVVAGAFPIMGALSLVSLLWIARLPADAGESMSGRKLG